MVHQTMLYSSQCRPEKSLTTTQDEHGKFIDMSSYILVIQLPRGSQYRAKHWQPNRSRSDKFNPLGGVGTLPAFHWQCQVCRTKKCQLWQWANESGYKVFVLSDISGFSYNFELFSGAVDNKQLQNEPVLSASSNLVRRPACTIPTCTQLYFDKWFTYFPLLVFL